MRKMADNTFTHVCSLRLFLSISSVSPLPSQKKKRSYTQGNRRERTHTSAPLCTIRSFEDWRRLQPPSTYCTSETAGLFVMVMGVGGGGGGFGYVCQGVEWGGGTVVENGVGAGESGPPPCLTVMLRVQPQW